MSSRHEAGGRTEPLAGVPHSDDRNDPVQITPSPSFRGFGIGPFTIHIYGILMSVAVATAYMVTVHRYQLFSGDRAVVKRAGFWVVVTHRPAPDFTGRIAKVMSGHRSVQKVTSPGTATKS